MPLHVGFIALSLLQLLNLLHHNRAFQTENMDNSQHEKKSFLPLSWARNKLRLRAFRFHKTEGQREKEYPILKHAPSVPALRATPVTASGLRKTFASTLDLTTLPERFGPLPSLFSSRQATKATAESTVAPAKSECPTHVVDTVEVRKGNQEAAIFNPVNSCLAQHPNLRPCQSRTFFEDERADLDEYRTYLTNNVFTFADAVNERTNLTDRLDSARKHLLENTKDAKGVINTYAFPRPPHPGEERMKLAEHPHHIEYYFTVLKEFAVAHGWKGPGTDSLQRAATNSMYALPISPTQLLTSHVVEYEDLDWDDHGAFQDEFADWDKFDFGYLPIVT